MREVEDVRRMKKRVSQRRGKRKRNKIVSNKG